MNAEISLFDKYEHEIENDLHFDDFNIKDAQLKLPSIKHKWVGRLIQQKKEKEKLKNVCKEAIEKIVQQQRDESVVQLSDKTYYHQAENHELVRKIDLKIKDCDILIDYLEKVEKIFGQTTFDIKNVIEIKKLELT